MASSSDSDDEDFILVRAREWRPLSNMGIPERVDDFIQSFRLAINAAVGHQIRFPAAADELVP